MGRPKMREGWHTVQGRGGVVSNDDHWTIEKQELALGSFTWRAMYKDSLGNPHVKQYGDTMDELCRWVERNDTSWRKRNVVRSPEKPAIPKAKEVPRSDMDALEFFCPCGRRYVVQGVPEASRL
jgi:hypothetical protein